MFVMKNHLSRWFFVFVISWLKKIDKFFFFSGIQILFVELNSKQEAKIMPNFL